MPAPTAVSVRPLRPEDRVAVIGLSPRLTIGVAPWREIDRVRRAARAWIEASLASADDEGRAVLVAEVDHCVVGVVTLAERTHFTGDVDGYVGELVTATGMEGRGVARALMAAAEEWARRRGLSRLTLETGIRNDRARELYRRAGFDEEDIRLTKQLSPRSTAS